jgi:galactokinase
MTIPSIHGMLKEKFAELFGSAEGTRLFFAPGRVNLIGEHTDYNGGYVFPAALSFGTYALVKPRQDRLYRFRSLSFPQQVDVSADQIEYRTEDDWANYPKGVLQQLIAYAPDQAASYRGADVLFYGNIPNGAGLSSSASIEMATAYALTRLAGNSIPVIELVKLAQRAENQFVGVNCGIMDQFAVGMGKMNHAVRLNCADLSYEYAPLRLDGHKLIITNTNKRRGLADSKYNERRAECEAGLAILRRVKPDLRDLGALSLSEWEELKENIEDPVIRARVEHVVSEDHRVLEAVRSLEENDLVRFGQLMIQSHDSLRDLYEVTGRELDALVEAALSVEGCIGSRMTGAGFGGCTVSLVREEAVDQFKQQVEERYTEATGLTPTFYVCDVGDGVKEITEV